MTYPDAVRRAGHADGNALFEAILASPLRCHVHRRTSTRTTGSWSTHADKQDRAATCRRCSPSIRGLSDAPAGLTTPEFPIVLSAGERRAYTANDIFRDPSWRKRDADGALRVSIEDAEALGLTDGGRARITTAAAAPRRAWRSARRCCRDTRRCRTDSASTTSTPTAARRSPGVAPNSLTSAELARRLRRHAMAQARSCADRGGGRRLNNANTPLAHR